MLLPHAPTLAAHTPRHAAPPPACAPRRRRPSSLCRAGSASGELPPPPDVPKLANLARLDVTAEEAAAWTPQIGAVVNWFGQLRELELPAEGEAPAEALESEDELRARLREDVPVDFPHREEMLAAAKKLESPFIRIPQVSTSEE
jgi:aspartyl-tRNA(Asn)/glutamyl-tRNA(Gln) amidotransferase subunit C